MKTLSSKIGQKWSPPRNPGSNLSSDSESLVCDIVVDVRKVYDEFFLSYCKKKLHRLVKVPSAAADHILNIMSIQKRFISLGLVFEDFVGKI